MVQKLSILIPVYNEEKTIERLLNKVSDVKIEGIKKEIIIVDDCSKDNTKEIITRINKSNLKTFFHKKNQGKGAAVRTALRHATGDIIIIQDADLEYDPKEYPKLLKPILNGTTKVVFGSRFLSKEGSLKQKNPFVYYIHVIGNWGLTKITNILFGSRLTDMETCYKVFRKEVIKGITLNSKKFDFEPEITAKILNKGYKIKEVPISYKSRDVKAGKKITWRDGIKAAYDIIRYRFFE